MAQILETLAVKLVLDAADFADGMSKAESKMAAFGQKLTSIGQGLTLGVTAPIVAMAAASINAAGDLGESINKVSVVFDENAAAVLAWSENSAKAFGQSQQQALEAAGTFGNLFDALGMTEQATLEMSIGLVELASDLASFNNIDPTIALEKLRAGIVGEVEPLRTLGVNLSAAAVEAKALEMGLAATAKELTEADKVTARYALILEQTTNAQGDFANTAEGLANATRIVQAQFNDAAAALGQSLLPAATQAAQILSNLLERFNNLDPATQAWIVKIALVAAAVGPVLVAIGSLITAVTTISAAFTAMGPIAAAVGTAIAALGGPITLIVAAVAALAVAWQQNWFGIRDVTKQAWEAIKSAINTAWNAIKSDLDSGLQSLKSAMDTAWNAMKQTVISTWDSIKSAITSAIDAVRNAVQSGMSSVQNIFSSVWNAIKSTIDNVLNSIRSAFQIDWSALGRGIIDGIASGIRAGAAAIVSAAQSAAQAALQSAKAALGVQSPSRVARDQVGIPFAEGIAEGINQGMRGLSADVAGQLNAMVGGISGQVHINGVGTGGVSISLQQSFYGNVDRSAVASGTREGVLAGLRQVGLA